VKTVAGYRDRYTWGYVLAVALTTPFVLIVVGMLELGEWIWGKRFKYSL